LGLASVPGASARCPGTMACHATGTAAQVRCRLRSNLCREPPQGLRRGCTLRVVPIPWEVAFGKRLKVAAARRPWPRCVDTSWTSPSRRPVAGLQPGRRGTPRGLAAKRAGGGTAAPRTGGTKGSFEPRPDSAGAKRCRTGPSRAARPPPRPAPTCRCRRDAAAAPRVATTHPMALRAATSPAAAARPAPAPCVGSGRWRAGRAFALPPAPS